MKIDDLLKAAGGDVSHVFAGPIYCKITDIPAGVVLTQHRHSFDHLSVLLSGMAVVTVDGRQQAHHGPEVLVIERGKPHEVRAVTDVRWACIHAISPDDSTSVERAERALVA